MDEQARKLWADTLEHGGATVWAGSLEPVNASGWDDAAWAVGGAMGIAESTFPVGPDAPERFLEAIDRLRGEWGVSIIGTWIEDGAIVVDATVVLADRASALEQGREWRQRAIYNLTTGETLEVPAEPAEGE